ncbi:MAG: hypothetical protein J5594_00875 [Elusimicrobiaceae bacterium]|nr:hypothetical protein [Elusimicrobiaceae bacterium]
MGKFIFGFISGIIASFVILAIIGYVNSQNDDNSLKFYEDPKMEHCLDLKELKIFQVLETNAALANPDDYSMSTFLILGREEQQFYDTERITIKKNQCFKQKGTYRYQSKDKNFRTVPIVVVE